MMFIKYNKFYVVILLVLLFGYCELIAQKKYKVKIKLKELKIIHYEFERELDSLFKLKRQCKSYDTTLFWSIRFVQSKNDIFVISVTMFSHFDKGKSNKEYKMLGYIKIDGGVFIVIGKYLHPDFFVEGESEKVFISINDEMPIIEDYDTWEYVYVKKKLFLKEAYILPCND